MGLEGRHCVPCEGGTPKLSAEEVERLLGEVRGWTQRGDAIAKSVTFANFVEAMRFVNAVADLAEAEGHHPDFCVHWNRVDLTVWTHAIGGLSENDFVLAARIDDL